MIENNYLTNFGVHWPPAWIRKIKAGCLQRWQSRWLCKGLLPCFLKHTHWIGQYNQECNLSGWLYFNFVMQGKEPISLLAKQHLWESLILLQLKKGIEISYREEFLSTPNSENHSFLSNVFSHNPKLGTLSLLLAYAAVLVSNLNLPSKGTDEITASMTDWHMLIAHTSFIASGISVLFVKLHYLSNVLQSSYWRDISRSLTEGT